MIGLSNYSATKPGMYPAYKNHVHQLCTVNICNSMHNYVIDYDCVDTLKLH